MAQRFGQTIFGMVSGVVTAAGLAVCLATAQGHIEVRKRVSGSPAVTTAQVQATAYRTLKIPVLVAQTSAVATGKTKAYWKASGTAQGAATVNGQALAYFYGNGQADGYVLFTGTPVRLTKPRTLPAKGEASISGEMYTFEFLYGKPAECSATLYGTTYHLAYGTAECSAQAQGRITWKAGVTSEGVSTGEAEGTAQYTIALWAEEAQVTATARAEDAVRIDGVRYLEVFGTAETTAEAVNTHIAIYPSVTVFVSAALEGRAAYVVGSGGHAQAEAVLEGTMLAAITAVTLVQGATVAQATGRIRAFHRFKGKAHVQATGNGVPIVTETGITGSSLSSATGSGTVLVTNTKVYPDTGYGVAKLSGGMNRVQFVSGAGASAYSQFSVKMEKIHNAHGVASAVSTLSGLQYRTRLLRGHAEGQATGKVLNLQLTFEVDQAVGTAELFGQMQRNHFASGIAEGFATSDTRVQVNDAVRAPSNRTLYVQNEERIVYALKEPRIIVV